MSNSKIAAAWQECLYQYNMRVYAPAHGTMIDSDVDEYWELRRTFIDTTMSEWRVTRRQIVDAFWAYQIPAERG